MEDGSAEWGVGMSDARKRLCLKESYILPSEFAMEDERDGTRTVWPEGGLKCPLNME